LKQICYYYVTSNKKATDKVIIINGLKRSGRDFPDLV